VSSKKSFVAKLEKVAMIGLLGTVAKGVGKAVIRAGGGKLNTALTGLGAVSDAQSFSDKLKQSYVR